MYPRHFTLILLFLVLPPTFGFRFRQKRVSDQRLAELETLVALSGLKGKLQDIKYGFGSVDPAKIGRRRRSAGVLLDRLLNSMEIDKEPLPWPWIGEEEEA